MIDIRHTRLLSTVLGKFDNGALHQFCYLFINQYATVVWMQV